MRKKINLYRILILLLLSLGHIGQISGEDSENFFFYTQSPNLIPENYETRQSSKQTLLSPAATINLAQKVLFTQQENTQQVLFQIVKHKNSLFFLFLNQSRFGYRADAKGNYIIKRNLQDGSFEQVKIFIRDNPGCFIIITPQRDNCLMDLYLFDKILYKNIFIPYPMQTLLFAPFSVITESTREYIDWPHILFFESNLAYMEIQSLVEKIRKYLPLLKEVKDGAMNSRGEFVYIKNEQEQKGEKGLNCSGFAKWIVDGYYRTLTGNCTDIHELKSRHYDYRGNRWVKRLEKEREPFFGLDWTRNLALSLLNARENRDNITPEIADVRDYTFKKYIEDIGYPVEELELLLFTCAIQDAGHFYFGAVNGDIGDDPVLRQYYHVAVFFPYFDDNGQFKVVVMEKNKETDIKTFIDKYKIDYIHLVRIENRGEYVPVPIK